MSVFFHEVTLQKYLLLMKMICYNTIKQGGIILTEGNELDSTCGISDEELTERFKASIKIDQDICKIKGLPIAGYDDELDSPYIEYPDGRRVYPNEKQAS